MGKTVSANDGRQDYELYITTDRSFDLGHDKKENLLKARECFAHAAFLARWELCHGLVRGGVPPSYAVTPPQFYFGIVFQHFERLAASGPTAVEPDWWHTLKKWEPEPVRFEQWFGVKWSAITNLNMKNSFRHTILGTLLGLLGNKRHCLHLNTGDSGTMGNSWPVHRQRYWFNWGVYIGQPSYGMLNDWILHRHSESGLFELHPFSFQDFALGIVHVQKRANPTIIKLKRPTKRYTWESTEWKTQWCHTLFHEASHHYGMTMDYFYLSHDSSSLKIRTYLPPECMEQIAMALDVQRVRAGTAIGQAYPVFEDHVVDDHLPLVNADSVAAYLMGYHSPDEFIMSRA